MNRHLILPYLLILASGMGIGSLHNAEMRGALPSFFTPLGFFLIAATFLIFVAGFVAYRYYDHPGRISRFVTLVFAALAMMLELVNLGQTLSAEGSISGWLFHEYLGLGASVLMFGKLVAERQQRVTPA